MGASQGRVALVARRNERNLHCLKSESSLFGSFSLSQERKRKRTSGLNVTIIRITAILTPASELRFSLTQKAQRKARKRNAAMRLRVQEVAFEKAPQNFWFISSCEHGALNINLPFTKHFKQSVLVNYRNTEVLGVCQLASGSLTRHYV